MDIKTEKTRARLQAKQRRKAEHNPASANKILQIFPAQEFRTCTFAGYWPLPGELDIRPLLTRLSEMGASLALPCTPPIGQPLIFRNWQPSDRLKAGPFKTREPYPKQDQVWPDFVFVPLLAFTEQGERLGYGGGFYDRTLERLRTRGSVFTCGIAYDGQKTAHLPTESHDAQLDAILTPSEFKRFNQNRKMNP